MNVTSRESPVADGKVLVTVSTFDGQYKLTDLPAISLSQHTSSANTIIEVDSGKTAQELLGMGASLDHATCSNLQKLPLKQREMVIKSLVSPKVGIGMNLMRLCIGTSDFTGEPYYTYNDLPDGETDSELSRFSIDKDRSYIIPTIKMAKKANKDLLFFASPWSPPAWMKTSGKLGTGSLKREYFDVYARYLLRYVQAYQEEGIHIHALTLQNEPQHQDRRYPTTIMSAIDQRDFIRDHIGPLFRSKRIKTKIWCWDHNWNLPSFPTTILSDPQAAQYVDGTAFHHYEGTVDAQSALKRDFPGKDIYFTEGSLFGIDGALSLIDILRNDARSYNAWVILLDEHRKPNRGPHPASATCIELLDDGSIRTNFDYYMQGQFMKFLGRGAVRLASSDGSKTCRNVAFLSKDGITTLVIANDAMSPAERTIVSGTKQFDIKLPPKSIATLRWRV